MNKFLVVVECGGMALEIHMRFKNIVPKSIRLAIASSERIINQSTLQGTPSSLVVLFNEQRFETF